MSGHEYILSGEEEALNERRKWIVLFDGVIWKYANGYAAKMEVKLTAITEFQPEGIEYSFTFHEPGQNGALGKRIYGLDNSHSPDKKKPNDHEHKTIWPGSSQGTRPRQSKGTRVSGLSLSSAFDKFPLEVAKILERLGLPCEEVEQTTIKEAKQRLTQARKKNRLPGSKNEG